MHAKRALGLKLETVESGNVTEFHSIFTIADFLRPKSSFDHDCEKTNSLSIEALPRSRPQRLCGTQHHNSDMPAI
jgi:hypothetical protein